MPGTAASLVEALREISCFFHPTILRSLGIFNSLADLLLTCGSKRIEIIGMLFLAGTDFSPFDSSVMNRRQDIDLASASAEAFLWSVSRQNEVYEWGNLSCI